MFRASLTKLIKGDW